MFFPFQKKKCVAILGLLSLSVCSSSADVVTVLPGLANLERATVFTLGLGLPANVVSGNAYIEGEVMVGGNGRITLRSQAIVNGDIEYRSNGDCRLLGDAQVTGGIYSGNDAELDAGVLAAINASNQAFALAPNRSYSDIKLGQSQNITISGAPGETVVLRLRDFRLSGNAVLTLQGTATTTFIINVSRQFSLSGHSSIVLSGGLQWNGVLFNVRGGGTASIKGDASFQGILLATGRTVVLNGRSLVSGEIIANRVLIGGSSRVTHPPVTSP